MILTFYILLTIKLKSGLLHWIALDRLCKELYRIYEL